MKKTDIYRYTSIGRQMDLKQPSNVVIILLSVILLAGGFIFQVATGYGWQKGIFWGLGISVTVFLAWALSRETEPGNDIASYISSGLVAIIVFYYYPPNFIALIWLMLALRIVNRSTGYKARWHDSILITLISGWLVYIGFWQFALLGAITFLADAYFPSKDRKQVIFSLVHILLLVLAFVLKDRYPTFYAPSLPILIPLILVILLLPVTTILQNRQYAKDDRRQKLLKLSRIRATRLLALFLAMIVTFWQGDAGFRWIMPLWCALAGSAIYRSIILARMKIKKKEI